MLYAGYAQTVITPELTRPVYLAGFGRNRRAETNHDDLYARALALSLGETAISVVAVDLIGLARRHCQEIEQRVTAAAPGAQLLIACTHTHHGPDTIGLWGPTPIESGVDPAYLERIKGQIAEAALAALGRLQPVRLRTAAVRVYGVAKNARSPDVVDEELTCVALHADADNAPLATVLIFPCHPEVLWDDNTQITADYCHFLRLRVEEATRAPCLVMVGALGGMMTPAMGGHTFADAERMGRILAQAATAALNAAPLRSAQTLRCFRQEFSLPLANPLFSAAAEAGLLLDPSDRSELKTEASLLCLDDLWLYAVPGELLPGLGLAYKAALRSAGAANAAIVGLVNDELGYILPADEFVVPVNWLDPGPSYEESMSVSAEAGPRLTAVLTELLSALR